MGSATSSKRDTTHHSGGGRYAKRPWAVFTITASVFVLAWLIWTFWFSAAVR